MTTTEKLISLAAQIAWRQVEFARLKAFVRERDDSSPGVTIYSVKKTRVRSHTRSAYVAVRVTVPKN